MSTKGEKLREVRLNLDFQRCCKIRFDRMASNTFFEVHTHNVENRCATFLYVFTPRDVRTEFHLGAVYSVQMALRESKKSVVCGDV